MQGKPAALHMPETLAVSFVLAEILLNKQNREFGGKDTKEQIDGKHLGAGTIILLEKTSEKVLQM